MIDIGTGDGRFVSASAKANPNTFYVGIDANVKPLEKSSMKATRKPSKGGLPNALFVQAAVENLPPELDGVANKIHILFPWGSLLRAVAAGDELVLRSLFRIARPGCVLEIMVGIDAERDRGEIGRLGVPDLSTEYLHVLIAKYKAVGFDPVDCRWLGRSEWSKIETSWARRLNPNANRSVVFLLFKKN